MATQGFKLFNSMTKPGIFLKESFKKFINLFNLRLVNKNELEFYEDMEYRFSVFLCDATGSRMSKTNYTTEAMRNEMQSYQEDFFNDTFKSDIKEILDSNGSLEDIKDYIDSL